MNEKVTRFYEAVSTDKGLQEELVEVTSDIDLDLIAHQDTKAGQRPA